MSFSNLTKRQQVARLRPVAKAMLRHYPIEVKRVRLVTHLFNTTFRIDAVDGRAFALRMNTNSKREPEEMNAEVAWVDAIARETDVQVPVPQKTEAGQLIVEAPCPDLGRELRGVLYSWLPGPNASKNVTPEVARAAGELSAKLHRHAQSFRMPEGAALYPLKDPLFGHPYGLREWAPDVDHTLYERTFEESTALVRRLQSEPLFPVHYDIHMSNVKWHRGRPSVFDFDDSLLGSPVFDAYVSCFHNRNRDNWPELEASYFDGLGRPATDLGVTIWEFELLIASRAILLANELFRWGNPEMSAIAPKYAHLTETRLRHFYETGVFDPLVARLS